MPEPTATGAAMPGIAAPATATQNAEQGNSGAAVQNAPQTVSTDEFRRLQEGVGKLFASIRNIESSLNTAKPAEPKQSKPDELGLTERIAKIERERAEMELERRETALLSAATSAGVPSDRAEYLLMALDKRLGDRLQVQGRGRAVVRDETGSELPLQKYLAEFVASDAGAMFRPPQVTASLPATGRKSGEMNAAAAEQMTYEQLMKQENAGLLKDLLRNQPDILAAKKAQHYGR
jgi:hypothetical protein